MTTETEKIEAPAAAPAAAVATDAAPAVAEASPAETKSAAPVVTPATAPPAAPAGRGGKPKKKPGGSPGGMPNRRIVENVPMLREDFGQAPKLADIDAEIAGELEAAFGELNQATMVAGNTSREDRKDAEASGETRRKKGKILAIHGPDVFIDVPGGRGQGVMAMLQFGEEIPKVGDEVEFSIEGFDNANGVLLLSRKWGAMQADWSNISEGMIVEARVVEANKGGLTVDVNGIRGFLPISQIDLYRVEQTDQFINQKFDCIVTEAIPSERNLVVSRRALLEKQREENREKLWATLDVGQIHEGIVRNVKDFGAFVDLGGVDGFVHVSEISWQRQQSATAFLQPGQKVRCAILKIDKETRKLSLSLKQLEASPWDGLEQRFPIGTVCNGTVTRTADFGAFVELEPGVEGLVHVSELAGKRVWRVEDVAKVGQEVTVKIMGIDKEARRISLSIRQAIPREEPKPVEEEAEDDGPVKPVRPHNFELRGGLGRPLWMIDEKK